ncbi:MAG TPA: glycosyltransferase family 8 protein [Methanocorpusculum sp.]|nr:glycosyltransferase family 8 protein [Methanocorpusculum sp.]
MTIPVVFSTDHNFIMPTSVALVSLLECSTDCSLQIFILQSDDVTDQDRSPLDELCKRHGAELHWISLGDAFKGAHETKGRVTIPAYYRLMIPWLLPEMDKVLYCDGDIIFLQSVSNIFSFNLGDCYLGGVRESGFFKEYRGYKYCRSIGVDSDGYVNSGVLLMNTRKMREMNLKEEFMSHAEKKYTFHDQDIINIVCAGHIAYMPSVFNRFPTEDSVRIDPVIIHYAGNKPWKVFTLFWANWWDFYSRSPFFNPELQIRIEATTHSLTHLLHSLRVTLISSMRRRFPALWRFIDSVRYCRRQR